VLPIILVSEYQAPTLLTSFTSSKVLKDFHQVKLNVSIEITHQFSHPGSEANFYPFTQETGGSRIAFQNKNSNELTK